MSRGQLYIVAPGTLGLTAAQVVGYLVGLAGPPAQRLRLTDEDIERARAGEELRRAIRVRTEELSETFRAFADGDRIAVWLRVAPHMRQTGTTKDAEGNEVPTFERVGTLVDLLMEGVRVPELEAALRAALPQAQVTRRDGTAVPAAQSPVQLLLVPAADVLTPAVEYSGWSPPLVVTDPVPLA